MEFFQQEPPIGCPPIASVSIDNVGARPILAREEREMSGENKWRTSDRDDGRNEKTEIEMTLLSTFMRIRPGRFFGEFFRIGPIVCGID